MLTSKQCLARYGDPVKEKHMVLWMVPLGLQVSTVPKRIYCNNDLIGPLSKALIHIKDRRLSHHIKTWDGCFNIRKKRLAASQSLHSWGVAIDINAAWNGYSKTPSMSAELVACFTDAGFDWGGYWTKPDGMHFQLRALP